MQQLQVLSLRSCRDIGDGRFLRRLPSLKSLDISWCYSVKASEVGVPHRPPCGCMHIACNVLCFALRACMCVGGARG